MTDPTISLSMIVRNGGKSLAACLDSVKGHVDEIVIVLAGESEDDTREVALRYTDKVYDFEWVEDFAAARNFSFEKATGDWFFWLDHDDVVRGAENLHRLAAVGEQRDFGCFHLPYQYRFDAKGNLTVVHNRERLMRRTVGWEWKDRVHEYCAGQTSHIVGFSDDVVVVHTNNEANHERNYRLLKLMESEDPTNPRMLASLADYHQSRGEWESAIAYSERVLDLDTLREDDFRWNVMTELARSNQALQRWDEVQRWCLNAIAVHPEYSLPYLLMAHAAWFGMNDADRAMLFLKDADDREMAPQTIVRQPGDYTLNRWDTEHRVRAALGDYEGATKLIDMAVQVAPDPGRWLPFKWFYMERINQERSVKGIWDVVNHLFARGDTLRAWDLLNECVPVSIQQDPRIEELKAEVWQAVKHVYNEDDYRSFYETEHSHGADDSENTMNAIAIEPYRLDPLIERLRKRGAKRVLDVGCGAGEPAIYLAQHGFTVVGLDINQAAITEARRRAKKAFPKKTHSWCPVEFRQGTYDTVGPEDLGKFDAVVMMELIEHIRPNQVPFYLSSAEDFLNPGGAVFLTTPGMMIGDIPGLGSDFPRDHVREYTRNDLAGLVLNYPGKRDKRLTSLYRLYDEQVPIPGFASWFMEYELYKHETEPEAWQQPVAIYVGSGIGQWDPTTPETEGIGGSETWAAKVAKELRERGHPVVVYAEADGVWDGVVYAHYSVFNPERPFAGEPAWLCIVSRMIEKLDVRPNAEHVLFIAHDTDYGDLMTPERAANADAYCVMSEWQREHTLEKYPWLDAATRVACIANGIEPSYFLGEEERQPHRFVWSSSADRGLDVLLQWWPQIREMWEDAELHVYYGFEGINALMGQRSYLPPFKAKVDVLLRQPGVFMHGKVGQKALARELMKSQFWLYPSTNAFAEPWLETYCITALEVQAAGCIPIIPSCGALPERFYFGSLIPEEQLNLADVLEHLQSWDAEKPILDNVREQGMKDVLENTWSHATDLLMALCDQRSPALVREEATP